jgi:crotonobetainyl-CoA:carnitine CoA-transferase CaiB-like acyl-CoA transferase
MSFTPASKALARFKVLDLTRVRAAPTAARQFSDRGADVVKMKPEVSTKAIWAGRGMGPISRTFIATSEASRSI